MSTHTTRETMEAANADCLIAIDEHRKGRINDVALVAATDRLELAQAHYRAEQAKQARCDDDPTQKALRSGELKPESFWTGGGSDFKAFGGLGRKIAELAPTAFATSDLEDLHKSVTSRNVATKAAITSTTAPMSAAPFFDLSNVYTFARDITRIADHIPAEMCDGPSVHYYRALTAASAAAAVAEGGIKPESTPTWSEVTCTIRKLAHWASVNDEVVADWSGFLRLVGNEMIAGLIDTENDQILNGSGVAPNLVGLLNTPGIQTVGSAGTDIDAISDACLAIRTSVFLEPDTIVMHPLDWSSGGFALAKDTTGRHLLGDPSPITKPQLWGIPVVLTTRQTQNTALVANLGQAAKVYVRSVPTVEVAPITGAADFKANQTLIRAEERLGLAVIRPTAICTVNAV